MALFLETYTIPHDIPQQDLVYAMRTVNRGGEVTMVRCAYALSAGTMWCVTEASSEQAIRDAVLRIPFAFTLEKVEPIASPDAVNMLADADCIFDPRTTRPADVGVPASRPA